MHDRNISMVNLFGQYQRLESEINEAVINVMKTGEFINGPDVKIFQKNLEEYLNVRHVIPCANGTDALQIALMALGLKPGDEVICPAFTYVATAEVVCLLGLIPVMVEVDPDSFNCDISDIEAKITPKTRAIVPVHMFGQACNMEEILKIAKKYSLFIIEDNAQAIGANYYFSNGEIQKAGTIGDIGCTSFFPSKNLGCYGDGGAIMTNNDILAKKIRMIANHGQEKKYYHKIIGCNSRLDTMQAAILNIKLKHLDEFCVARNRMAEYYDKELSEIPNVSIPKRSKFSTHVFHQYTIRVKNNLRDGLREFLAESGIPTMIYYPLPLYKQEAFATFVPEGFVLPEVEKLCQSVLSLPIHTEVDFQEQNFIISTIKKYISNE